MADIKGSVIVETHPLGVIEESGAMTALSFDEAYRVLSPFVPSFEELNSLIERHQQRLDCFKEDAAAAAKNADWETLSSLSSNGKIVSDILRKLRTSRENHYKLKY